MINCLIFINFLIYLKEEKDKEKKPKKNNVCFASKNRLVTAHSANNYEFTADSLDPTTQSLIHDQDDCEEASLDSKHKFTKINYNYYNNYL